MGDDDLEYIADRANVLLAERVRRLPVAYCFRVSGERWRVRAIDARAFEDFSKEEKHGEEKSGS